MNKRVSYLGACVPAALLVAALSVCGPRAASAGVVGEDLGTASPPSTLGGYAVNPYDPGSIGGEAGAAHETNGSDDGSGPGYWATWGQSYTGNVYYTFSSPNLTLSLSGNTEAVYFYEEPNQFSDFTMTATDSSGATVSTTINGYHGSSGVGFYETIPGGPYLTSIVVTAGDPTGFAVGEFGISSGGSLIGNTGSTPLPSAGWAGMALLGGMGLLKLRRKATV